MDGKGIFVVFVATLCFSVMMTSSASPDESRDTSSLDSSDSSSSSTSSDVSLSREDCRLRPIIHQLKYPGCIPKSIPSFACQGHCSSYVQVSMMLVSQFLCDKSSYIFFSFFSTHNLAIMTLTGLWIQILAGRAILHVLSRKWRTRGNDRNFLSKTQTSIQKGSCNYFFIPW